MKRSPMKPGTKGLQRTPFKRAEPLARTSTLTSSKPMARKRMKASSKPAHTVAESAYLGAVAALGCAVCRRLKFGITPAIVHHQRTSTGKMRATHWRVAPLCPTHHQDSGIGVHDMGRRQFEEMYGFSEVDLVEETRSLLIHLIPLEHR